MIQEGRNRVQRGGELVRAGQHTYATGRPTAAIGTLVSALEEGTRHQVLLEVTGSGKTCHGQCDRTDATARSGIGPQQNARWAIVC